MYKLSQVNSKGEFQLLRLRPNFIYARKNYPTVEINRKRVP